MAPTSLREWQERGTLQLTPSSDTAWLDAELLLAFVMGCERTELLLHESEVLAPSQADQFKKLIAQRAEGCPVAYLIGTQEFWSLTLHVAPGVLIPRPETEGVVEAVPDHVNPMCRFALRNSARGLRRFPSPSVRKPPISGSSRWKNQPPPSQSPKKISLGTKPCWSRARTRSRYFRAMGWGCWMRARGICW